MADIRGLSRLTNDATPADLQPSSGPPDAPTANTAETVVDVVRTVLDPASVITDAIGDETVAAILNPGGALIKAIADLFTGVPQIKWSSFPGPLPGTGDIVSVEILENVVAAGEVEIALKTGTNTRGWKGIAFNEFDANGKVQSSFKISNDPNDQDVWDRTQYNVLPLYTPQLANAVLQFSHEGLFGVHATCYLMAALGEKLKDGARVTFTWLKD
jgi:hypothetical protein